MWSHHSSSNQQGFSTFCYSRTPNSILSHFAYPQPHFCLPFVGLFWYILKFHVPPANCLRPGVRIPQVENHCSNVFYWFRPLFISSIEKFYRCHIYENVLVLISKFAIYWSIFMCFVVLIALLCFVFYLIRPLLMWFIKNFPFFFNLQMYFFYLIDPFLLVVESPLFV
jgi:hypothetical protein